MGAAGTGALRGSGFFPFVSSRLSLAAICVVGQLWGCDPVDEACPNGEPGHSCDVPVDAGMGESRDLPAAPAPPEIPWLDEGQPPVAAPQLTPCPEGWREVRQPGRAAVCDPYPEGGSEDCGPGEAHFPGESGCRPVGSPCPADDHSNVLPSDRPVVYVTPGATGGDGASPSSPHGSVSEVPWGTLLAG